MTDEKAREAIRPARICAYEETRTAHGVACDGVYNDAYLEELVCEVDAAAHARGCAETYAKCAQQLELAEIEAGPGDEGPNTDPLVTEWESSAAEWRKKGKP